jgi:hypothetical protein
VTVSSESSEGTSCSIQGCQFRGYPNDGHLKKKNLLRGMCLTLFDFLFIHNGSFAKPQRFIH